MSEQDLHFHCSMCGLCCQRVGCSDIYRYLDRGDGVCWYYEDLTHKCSIYSTRPLICNVEVFYEKYMKSKMRKEEFFALNYEACDTLKEQ